MMHNELIPHLFRIEFRKITAVLCKTFGLAHMEIAADIASDTFLSALETWPYKGIPDNPTAWLYTVAKNKAKNQLNRNKNFKDKVAGRLLAATPSHTELELDLSDKNIFDSQLQMLFAICNPAIPVEAQIALSLRILCGFGIEEIANAFLTSREVVNKRLYRARQKLREENIAVEMPPEPEIGKRLEAVLTSLYLLFNEGYYSESDDEVVRQELCEEAMRLACLLVENELTNQPAVNALIALMCFQASRLKARKSIHGEIILYHDQDETLWDRELISKGGYFLQQASRGDQLSKYHLEASIAYWHTIKADSSEKWQSILGLFDLLIQVDRSPVVAMNRTYALSKVKGKLAAIAELEKLQLNNNHYYFLLLGDLYTGIDDEQAKQHFRCAVSLAKSRADRISIQQKLDKL